MMILHCKVCGTQLTMDEPLQQYQCYYCPVEKVPHYSGHYAIGFRVVDTAWFMDGEDFIYYPFYIMKRENAWHVGCDWDKPGALFAFLFDDIEFKEMFPDFNPKNIEEIREKLERLRVFA